MRAVELQSAAKKIAEVLRESDVLSVIRDCRSARGDDWSQVAGSLLATGSGISATFSSMDEAATSVLRATHLDKLATNEYWAALASADTKEQERQAELVRLYSRAMFASNHLPMLVMLLEAESDADTNTAPAPVATAETHVPTAQVPDGQHTLLVKLVDAGEKAADPDRVARAIDGVDMLYSACASLDRRVDSELALLTISGAEDRDIQFAGDTQTLLALKKVIESIPAALEGLNPDDEIDLHQLILSLPVFDDIATLQTLGTYSDADLDAIKESMHQGVMLSLESGMVLVSDSHTNDDEYYDQYLRERKRLAASDSVNTILDNAVNSPD